MNKLECVSVGFIFKNTDEHEINDRLNKARKILGEKGGNFAERENFDEEKNQKIVEFIARIPKEQSNLHHGFDSKLNKGWPEGCGAAWVTDSSECDEK